VRTLILFIISYGFFDKSKFSGLDAESKKKEQTIVSGLVMFSIQRSLGTSWLQ
jgi:hypothetical protein